VKYFTDLPAVNGYPITALFPRDDLMTMVMQGRRRGCFGDGRRMEARGQARVHDAELCDRALHQRLRSGARRRALAAFAKSTIGLVCTYQMGYATGDHLKRAFPAARSVEATDLVDRIKAIKSEEEKELIARTARSGTTSR
jgi:Xaa-Pro aminopeptidase